MSIQHPFLFSLACWFGSAYRRSFTDTNCGGLRGLLEKLGEPRMSACLSVDLALTRPLELRQIRGTHLP